MTTNKTIVDKTTRVLQWYRVPIGLALAALMLWYIGEVKPPMPFVWAGMVVALFGEWIQVCAAAHLHKNQNLAASGPYLRVRNPMYIGRFFVLLGFILMFGKWYYVAAYVAMFAYYAQTRVGREESRLVKTFGESYVNYCNSVNRWFPRMKPYEAGSGRRFSWHQVVVNHEYLNVIGILVLFVVIYLRLQ